MGLSAPLVPDLWGEGWVTRRRKSWDRGSSPSQEALALATKELSILAQIALPEPTPQRPEP